MKKLSVACLFSMLLFICIGCGGSSTNTPPSNPTAATPTFLPAAGTYAAAQSVTLYDTTPGAAIYYTTNGSTPTTGSTLYSGAIAVSTSETIQAIAAASGYNNSAVASAAYTINLPQLAAPTISPVSGAVPSGQLVTITAASGASINYCITATTCTPTTPYTGAITVTSAETIQAIAVETGYVSSTVASASYTLETQLAAPTISPVSGAVPSGQLVTITAASGASINYCITATTCTPTTPYTGAITVTSAET
ncbi:MAG: chitobiase/beta-hexosaminidase C-terminal domain-containing protein, partial [Terracidiphilus sp.]